MESVHCRSTYLKAPLHSTLKQANFSPPNSLGTDVSHLSLRFISLSLLGILAAGFNNQGYNNSQKEACWT